VGEDPNVGDLAQEELHSMWDVSKANEVEAMVKKVVGKFGKVDILINNAVAAGSQPTAATASS